MVTLLTVIHIATCVLLVLLVLVQSGKGAEISASFGGSSQTVFGSSGGANFFTKLTAGAATVFMVTSLYLTIKGSDSRKSVFDRIDPKPITKKTDPASTSAAPAAAPTTKEPKAPEPKK